MNTPEYFLNNYGNRDLILEKAKGLYVWDINGNRYLDCVMGVAVHAFGHSFAPVLAAVKSQVESLSHVSNYYLTPSQINLASKLVEVTGYARVFFSNSGTEANEALIKIVRKYWHQKNQFERSTILSFENSFHGRTYGSLSATGQAKLKQGFGKMLPGFTTLPLNDPKELLSKADDSVAAILVEPILAEGGVISLTPEFIDALIEVQKRGILLLCDEIQTGMGRTGTFLASPGIGLQPDAVSMAKALGGGLPLGCVAMTQNLADCIGPGDHGTTFGGNPVACAAGLQIIKAITSDGFLQSSIINSRYLREGLQALIAKEPGCPFSPHILGKGFLIGITCKGDVKEIILNFRKNGLLVCPAGPGVIRLLPPINLNKTESHEILAAFEKSMVK